MEERLTLNDPDLLRKLMEHAPGGGLTIRRLAAKVGVSKSKIGGLLSGVRPGLSIPDATRVAEVVGVHRDALFTPKISTFVDVNTQGGSSADRDPSREESADADRCP